MFVQIILLGPNWPCSRGHMFYSNISLHVLHRFIHKQFLTEITEHRALIFGMEYHLVDLYHYLYNTATS